MLASGSLLALHSLVVKGVPAACIRVVEKGRDISISLIRNNTWNCVSSGTRPYKYYTRLSWSGSSRRYVHGNTNASVTSNRSYLNNPQHDEDDELLSFMDSCDNDCYISSAVTDVQTAYRTRGNHNNDKDRNNVCSTHIYMCKSKEINDSKANDMNAFQGCPGDIDGGAVERDTGFINTCTSMQKYNGSNGNTKNAKNSENLSLNGSSSGSRVEQVGCKPFEIVENVITRLTGHVSLSFSASGDIWTSCSGSAFKGKAIIESCTESSVDRRGKEKNNGDVCSRYFQGVDLTNLNCSWLRRTYKKNGNQNTFFTNEVVNSNTTTSGKESNKNITNLTVNNILVYMHILTSNISLVPLTHLPHLFRYLTGNIFLYNCSPRLTLVSPNTYEYYNRLNQILCRDSTNTVSKNSRHNWDPGKTKDPYNNFKRASNEFSKKTDSTQQQLHLSSEINILLYYILSLTIIDKSLYLLPPNHFLGLCNAYNPPLPPLLLSDIMRSIGKRYNLKEVPDEKGTGPLSMAEFEHCLKRIIGGSTFSCGMTFGDVYDKLLRDIDRRLDDNSFLPLAISDKTSSIDTVRSLNSKRSSSLSSLLQALTNMKSLAEYLTKINYYLPFYLQAPRCDVSNTLSCDWSQRISGTWNNVIRVYRNLLHNNSSLLTNHIVDSVASLHSLSSAPPPLRSLSILTLVLNSIPCFHAITEIAEKYRHCPQRSAASSISSGCNSLFEDNVFNKSLLLKVEFCGGSEEVVKPLTESNRVFGDNSSIEYLNINSYGRLHGGENEGARAVLQSLSLSDTNSDANAAPKASTISCEGNTDTKYGSICDRSSSSSVGRGGDDGVSSIPALVVVPDGTLGCIISSIPAEDKNLLVSILDVLNQSLTNCVYKPLYEIRNIPSGLAHAKRKSLGKTAINVIVREICIIMYSLGFLIKYNNIDIPIIHTTTAIIDMLLLPDAAYNRRYSIKTNSTATIAANPISRPLRLSVNSLERTSDIHYPYISSEGRIYNPRNFYYSAHDNRTKDSSNPFILQPGIATFLSLCYLRLGIYNRSLFDLNDFRIDRGAIITHRYWDNIVSSITRHYDHVSADGNIRNRGMSIPGVSGPSNISLYKRTKDAGGNSCAGFSGRETSKKDVNFVAVDKGVSVNSTSAISDGKLQVHNASHTSTVDPKSGAGVYPPLSLLSVAPVANYSAAQSSLSSSSLSALIPSLLPFRVGSGPSVSNLPLLLKSLSCSRGTDLSEFNAVRPSELCILLNGYRRMSILKVDHVFVVIQTVSTYLCKMDTTLFINIIYPLLTGGCRAILRRCAMRLTGGRKETAITGLLQKQESDDKSGKISNRSFENNINFSDGNDVKLNPDRQMAAAKMFINAIYRKLCIMDGARLTRGAKNLSSNSIALLNEGWPKNTYYLARLLIAIHGINLINLKLLTSLTPVITKLIEKNNYSIYDVLCIVDVLMDGHHLEKVFFAESILKALCWNIRYYITKINTYQCLNYYFLNSASQTPVEVDDEITNRIDSRRNCSIHGTYETPVNIMNPLLWASTRIIGSPIDRTSSLTDANICSENKISSTYRYLSLMGKRFPLDGLNINDYSLLISQLATVRFWDPQVYDYLLLSLYDAFVDICRFYYRVICRGVSQGVTLEQADPVRIKNETHAHSDNITCSNEYIYEVMKKPVYLVNNRQCVELLLALYSTGNALYKLTEEMGTFTNTHTNSIYALMCHVVNNNHLFYMLNEAFPIQATCHRDLPPLSLDSTSALHSSSPISCDSDSGRFSGNVRFKLEVLYSLVSLYMFRNSFVYKYYYSECINDGISHPASKTIDILSSENHKNHYANTPLISITDIKKSIITLVHWTVLPMYSLTTGAAEQLRILTKITTLLVLLFSTPHIVAISYRYDGTEPFVGENTNSNNSGSSKHTNRANAEDIATNRSAFDSQIGRTALDAHDNSNVSVKRNDRRRHNGGGSKFRFIPSPITNGDRPKKTFAETDCISSSSVALACSATYSQFGCNYKNNRDNLCTKYCPVSGMMCSVSIIYTFPLSTLIKIGGMLDILDMNKDLQALLGSRNSSSSFHNEVEAVMKNIMDNRANNSRNCQKNNSTFKNVQFLEEHRIRGTYYSVDMLMLR